MTASPRRRQQDRTALSDRLLTEAAVGLLVERGIAGTTLAGIGERAGYSRGLVTHRFGSKAGLLAHVHDTLTRLWVGRVLQAVDGATGLAALQRVVDALYRFIVEQPDAIRALYLLRYSSIDPGADYRANIARVHEAQRRDLLRWVAAGQSEGSIDRKREPALAVELFCAAIDGLIYRWMVTPSLPIADLHDQLRSEIGRTLRAALAP
jgi:AcrR family transcriptional regulator